MKTHKLNLELSDQAYCYLQRVAREIGKDRAEVLADGLALRSWIIGAKTLTRDDGQRLVIDEECIFRASRVAADVEREWQGLG